VSCADGEAVHRSTRLLTFGSHGKIATRAEEQMSVISEIHTWNRGREIQRLRLKYAIMETDAFSFFRGTAHLFFRDWPLDTALDDAPLVWICGDLHLENFGSFNGDDGRAYFDVNDFDEAALAPASWDLARFLTSLHLAEELRDVAGLPAAFLEGYRETTGRGVPVSVVETDAAKPIRALLQKTAARSRKDLLDKRTEGKPRTFPRDSTGTAEQDAIARYLEMLPLDKETLSHFLEDFARTQTNPSQFELVDAARRVAGTGSLGLGRFAILVTGEGAPDGHFILDLKQEAVSAAALYGPPQPDWPNDATRIATVRRWTQPHPPMLFDAVRFRGKTWLIRELQPNEDRVKLSKYIDKPKALKALLAGMGRVTASMHLRGCAKQGAASVAALRRWAEISWTDVIGSYAEDYATNHNNS
jgi:uncharacterized protein (DUF2252 family)